MLVDVLDGGQDALLEFLFGGHADVAENGPSELGEELKLPRFGGHPIF